jgi:8-oxo-dGTP diphosphatase
MKLATLCYVKKDNQTLMLHRVGRSDDHHLGKWNGLGGKFLPGETPEECVRREVFEESGLTVSKLTLKGFITFPLFDGKDDWYVFIFTAEAGPETIRESAEGKLAWINDADLLTLELWPGDRIFLPWLEQEKIFSAKFFYKEKIFQKHEVQFYPSS